MKNIWLFFAVFFGLAGQALSYNVLIYEDSGVRVDMVKSLSNYSAIDIYRASKAWFARTFTSAKDVIQMDDPDGFIIGGRGSVDLGSGLVSMEIRYFIQAQAKQNKIRFKMDQFIYFGTPTYPLNLPLPTRGMWKLPPKTYQGLDLYCEALYSSLISSITNKAESSTSTNW